MVTTPAEITQQTKEQLSALEEVLAEPLVPGELTEWAAAVASATIKVEETLDRELRQLRPQQYETILREDAALAPRVEEMQRADNANILAARRLAKQLSTISEHAAQQQAAETAFQERVNDLVETGLRLVVDVRKQEAAVDTWFQEAFQRDRGVGD